MANYTGTLENYVANTTYVASVGDDKKLTVVLTCDNGYAFDGDIKGYGYDYNGDYVGGEYTTVSYNDDKTVCTLIAKGDFSDTSCNFTLTGKTKATGNTGGTGTGNTGGTDNKFIGEFSNKVPNTTATCTADNDGVATVIITCNDGYIFDGDISLYGFDDNGHPVAAQYYTVTGDDTKKTFVPSKIYSFKESYSSLTVDGKTKSLSTTHVEVNANLTNCTGTGYTNYVSNGDVLDITLTANSNCLFDTSTPVIAYDDEKGAYVQTQFIVSDDKKTATLKFTVPSTDKLGSKSITISASANVQQAVTGGYGLINVYVTNDNELNEFAKTRFYKTNDVTGTTVTPIDLGVYVNRLQRLYFNIPVKTTDVIKCGNYDTGVSTHAPVNNKIKHDFGTVEIPTVNNNTVDYQTVVQAFLPFVGFVNVPNDYVGKTVQLTFDVDIITGTGVYKLTCDNVVFAVYDCTPCTNVIYRTGDYDLHTIGGDNFNSDVYKGITPYIYIKEYKSTGVTRNNDNRRVQIGTMTGYNTFEDVTTIASDDMLQVEQTQIYDKLRTGVYIEAIE